MQTNWTENGPPVYIAAALYLGLTSKKKSKKKAPRVSEVDAKENANNLMALAMELQNSGGTFYGG